MQAENVPTQTAVPTFMPDPVESQTSTKIAELWQAHKHAEACLAETREELRLTRSNLIHHLGELKALLAKPGRNGAWSSFLKAYGISRSTGDRIARAHKETGETMVSEPTEATVCRCLYGLWPKLSRILTTMAAVEMFVNALREAAENSIDENHLQTSPSQAATPVSGVE